MTRKIGVSLPDDLYEWAARQVADGKADSVSALVADGLEVLAARVQLASLVADLRSDIGPEDAEARAWADAAGAAADEAARRGSRRADPQVA